jgi:hypothetical protein
MWHYLREREREGRPIHVKAGRKVPYQLLVDASIVWARGTVVDALAGIHPLATDVNLHVSNSSPLAFGQLGSKNRKLGWMGAKLASCSALACLNESIYV